MQTMNRFVVMIGVAAMVLASCQENIEKRFEREAREFTEKQCPKKIHADIRIDSMSYSVDDRTFRYYYTLSGQMDNAEAMASQKATFREMLLNGVINSVETKKPKEEGVSFEYIYRSETTGEVMVSELFTREDYSPGSGGGE